MTEMVLGAIAPQSEQLVCLRFRYIPTSAGGGPLAFSNTKRSSITISLEKAAEDYHSPGQTRPTRYLGHPESFGLQQSSAAFFG